MCYNAASTIERCIQSVIGQTFENVEYIVIDGASSDKTPEILRQYSGEINILIVEPDKGIYDAMNKGISLASGEVIGMLNADDFFADSDVLKTIADAFTQYNADIIYADLDYVDAADRITRKWRSGNYSRISLNFGWMPPHPTFYCKRKLFDRFGNYSLEYGSAADYELMLRFMYHHKIQAHYINKVMVKMKIGGVSNNSLRNRINVFFYDMKAMRNNGISIPIATVVLKPLRKIIQLL